MATTCPKCGFYAVERVECPRCGVDVAAYRGEMAVQSAVTGGSRPAATYAQPATVTGAPAPRRPAGFWIRVVAILIDGVALSAAQAVLVLTVWLVFGVGFSARPLRAALRALSLILGTFYPIVCHWQWGQTLGKMAMEIRVVTLAGGPLSFGRAALRQFGSWISAFTLGIGYLMAGLRSDKRALHDLIAGTRVERLS